MQLNTITELIRIPGYKVTHIISSRQSRIEFLMEREEEKACVCSGCGKVHKKGVHSEGKVLVEDLPISGKRVYLRVPKRKVVCLEDGRIRVEELDWVRGRFTKRFVEQVYRLTSITTNKEAGWYLGIDDETVYRLDKGMLEELAVEKLEKVKAPRHMSVDEVAWQKWHKYVTNVVDVDRRKVIWNQAGRGKATLDKFYHKIGTWGSKRIKAVASDGAKGFLSSTKEHAKKALIVLDHFHVKKYLNDAVDVVRKEELRRARHQGDEELGHILHCNKRFILLQNKVTNKQKDILDKLSTLNERVYKAMLLKEQFLSLYVAGNRRVAYANLKAWIRAAIRSGIVSFVELGYKFFRKRHYVLNYFVCKITSAISEGINNKIKRLKRMAYGYRDVKYFLLKIHQHCGLLDPKLST